MLQNKKHIIFDWNGTLIDDAFVFVDILNILLKERDLSQINTRAYRDLFCFPIKAFYEKIGLDVSRQSFLQLKETFIVEYNKRRYNGNLFPGVYNILQKLISNGISLSMLSASHQNTLEDLTKYYSIDQYFNIISGVDNYIADGKIVNGHSLIKSLNLNNEDIVLIGDTDHDYEVANNLNIDCVLVSHGHQSSNRLKQISNHVIDSLNVLL